MLFNTVSYVAFVLVVVTAFWSAPASWRQSILLVASLIFYGLWRVEYVFLILFSAFVDYFFSLRIAEATTARARRVYLLSSLATNIGLLIYFKYTYFLVENIAAVTGVSATDLKASVGTIILPLGISFYTFLSISYTIDVYRREFEPIRDFRLYLTYVLFWPHMIAGPILRAHELIPQITQPRRPDAQEFAGGIKLILFGAFLKVFLADQIAPLVDAAFQMPPSQLGGIDVLTMSFGFGQQIYFDFAGYSMMAIGSARLVGVSFPENFNWPYMATSPREFWRRWHITLSSWIRDYLYLPLSGLREQGRSSGGIDIQFNATRSAIRVTLALFLTWFIMGLWHGASWNFALWGLWHAGFIYLYRQSNHFFDAWPRVLQQVLGWGATLLIAMLGWIFFRAPDVATSLSLLGRLFDPSGYRALAFRETQYVITFAVMASMVLAYLLASRPFDFLRRDGVREPVEIVVLGGAMFIVFIFLRPVSQFIYFQF